MRLRVNGQWRETRHAISVGDLLAELNLSPVGTAVAVNEVVVPRANHATTFLCETDTVEIIHAVGGGTAPCCPS